MNKLFLKLSRKAGETIATHSLLQADDKVLIALSGGKDSYLLLEILADRLKHLPFKVQLFAVHVHIVEAGYRNDLEYMKSICEGLKVPLEIIQLNVDFEQNDEKAPCFVCSWHRRKAIFNYSKEIGCNKLAFGHHRDDALQTLLMNMIYHGSISSLPYKLKMFEGRVHLIRPLLDIEEKDIKLFLISRQYPKELEKCPYDRETKRAEVSDILDGIKKLHKHGSLNLFRSMGKIFPEYLPVKS